MGVGVYRRREGKEIITLGRYATIMLAELIVMEVTNQLDIEREIAEVHTFFNSMTSLTAIDNMNKESHLS